MTSLTETLPILDEAVPALPGKVEAVAREADGLHQALVDAMNALHAKREQSDALAEQVRQVLTALRDQSAGAQQRLEAAVQEVDQAADHAAHDVDEAEQQLQAEGGEAVAAMDTLRARLVQAGDHTRTAHDGARGALGALAEQARARGPELDAAVDKMAAAVHDAQQAIAEGQAQVGQGAAALAAAMERLAGEAQQRLARTSQKLEELRAEQERVVGAALTTLESGREHVVQEVSKHLESGVREAVEPELIAAADTLVGMSQQVMLLTSETQSRREGLEHEVGLVADRIPPLHGGVDEVKRAAQTIGVEWP
jgi:ABC-type transporter Mla subunit MlaD